MLSEAELRNKLQTYQRIETKIAELVTNVVAPKDSSDGDCLVVLMHGYGAPRTDLVGLAVPLLVDCFQAGKTPIFAFPGAMHQPRELGGGAAWWPINMARLVEAAAKNSFDEIRNEVPPGIDEARHALCDTVQALLDEYQFDSSRLVLGGFSQGAMLAVDSAARGHIDVPSGLIAFSGACICEDHWRSAKERLAKTRAFQSHGRQDQILPIETGVLLNGVLEDVCAQVDFVKFEGYHEIPEVALSGAAQVIAELN